MNPPLDRITTLEFWRAFWLHALETLVSRGLLILGILAGYFIARSVVYRLIDASVGRILSREQRSSDDRANRLRTLQGLARSLVGYLLFFILVIMLLDAFGANITGIITTAGVGGIAIGFGAQKLVKDVISGFFLIVEDQFVVGDYVTIGQATGIVEELGMRITRIRDDQGRLWILANGDIVTVTNHSRAPVESSIDIGVAHGADLGQAEAAISTACSALYQEERGGLMETPHLSGVSAWDSTHTVIRVQVIAEPHRMNGELLRVREAILRKLTEEQVPIG